MMLYPHHFLQIIYFLPRRYMGVREKIKRKIKGREEQRSQSMLIFVASAAIILSLVLSYFLIPDFKNFVNTAITILTSDDEDRIRDWVSGFGFWGPVFVIGAMTAQMFLIVIPSVILMVVSTLAYGPWWGSLISYVAVFIASSVAYFIGSHASTAFLDKVIGEKSKNKVEHYIQEYGAWAIVIFRVSPFLSNDAISFVAGLGQMRYLKFIAATTAGIIPLIAMIGYLGKDTQTLEKGMWWISGISIVVFLIYFFIRRRKKRKAAA